MIFKTMFQLLWHYLVVCLLLAIGFIVYGAFLFSFRTGIISVGLAFMLLGLISEMIQSVKGGDN